MHGFNTTSLDTCIFFFLGGGQCTSSGEDRQTNSQTDTSENNTTLATLRCSDDKHVQDNRRGSLAYVYSRQRQNVQYYGLR